MAANARSTAALPTSPACTMQSTPAKTSASCGLMRPCVSETSPITARERFSIGVSNMTQMTQGRRVAVTGAASGIGAATARKLMADGWRGSCLDRNLEGATATAGDRGLAVPIDVADQASTIAAFARVREAFGGLDALVTAAGVIETVPFLDTTVEQFRRLFDINVIGSLFRWGQGGKVM